MEYDISKTAQENFITGLTQKKPELVDASINMGANVNGASSPFGDKGQALPDILSNHSYLYSERYLQKYGRGEAEAGERHSIRQIVNRILEEDLDTKTLDEYGKNLGDGILGSLTENGFDKELVSSAIIKIIHDSAVSGQPYGINYRRIFKGIGSEPDHPARDSKMTIINEVLGRVRERLTDPKAEYEKKLVDNYPGLTEEWLGHRPPSILDLPVPSKQFINAVKDMEDAVSNISDIFSRFGPSGVRGSGTLSLTEEERERLRTSLSDAHEASNRASLESDISDFRNKDPGPRNN